MPAAGCGAGLFPMNRDKKVITVLAVLLVASLGANVMLWQRSRGGGVGEGPVVAAEMKTRPSGTRERGVPYKVEVVANPAMKGRLGRIVLTFAETEGGLDATRTVIYQAGTDKSVATDYGTVEAELLPGEYDLEVSGKKLAAVRVEPGKDTRVASGVLRLHGASNTRFVIYDVGGQDDSLYVGYGNSARGLPAGEYEVDVGGQREKVTIEPGKVTDF